MYKEAEVMVGEDNALFKERLESCARLEEEAFLLSGEAGVGSIIKCTHARYAIQNYFRCGQFDDVVGFGKEAVPLLKDPAYKKTVDQIDFYVNAAREKILSRKS